MGPQKFSNCNFPVNVLKPLPIAPKAPMIIGIMITFPHCQYFSISLYNSWYHTTYSCIFPFPREPNGHLVSVMWHSLIFKSRFMSCLLSSSLWLVCAEKFQSIFALSFSSTLSLVCVHTNQFQLEILIFCTSSTEQPH